MTENGKGLRLVEVAAGIIWRGERFLAAQRPTDKPLEGYWEFPGGKLEEGESPSEALVRELAEELGIGVRQCRFWQSLEHSYAERGFRVRLHFFHVSLFSGEPCPTEGQNLRWVTPAEALELGFLPADAHVLEQLRA
ncbi:(deoxy)nucleoside triphosphate pyrophosphohydrolase [uncultured Desulfovibrio sp.]|uniref:(deoxy)nucleoside triphosphate pyrophosphohydrolase n=1 Tax=uncultured Desulfovibrio sp. TaxID=167968 RepID=UPI00263A336A|nr:(deoxy)nucleoside triphosphate pyrophosphohydrolase [uncultured Desulfovibrio sp.]